MESVIRFCKLMYRDLAESIIRSPDSRNELMRVAVNGILQRGEDEERRNHGNRESRSSVSDSPYQASSASTLRDTEDLREVTTAAVFDVNHPLPKRELKKRQI